MLPKPLSEWNHAPHLMKPAEEKLCTSRSVNLNAATQTLLSCSTCSSERAKLKSKSQSHAAQQLLQPVSLWLAGHKMSCAATYRNRLVLRISSRRSKILSRHPVVANIRREGRQSRKPRRQRHQ